MKGSLLLASIIAVAACRMTPAPPPVPVQGAAEAVSAFSGDWVGTYGSKATGRHGTIRFSLAEHADTGYGEVEITFSPALWLSREASVADYPKTHPDELSPTPCTTIGITVVRIENDLVRGTMAPYWDPDCDCRAETVFEGKLAGNRITGTFSTRRQSADRRVLTGEWRVDRKH
jgi:hypothetical protein